MQEEPAVCSLRSEAWLKESESITLEKQMEKQRQLEKKRFWCELEQAFSLFCGWRLQRLV